MIISLEESPHKWHILLERYIVDRVGQVHSSDQVKFLWVQSLLVNQRLSCLEKAIIVLVDHVSIEFNLVDGSDALVYMESVVEGDLEVDLV